MDGLVTALGTANRPGAAGIVRSREGTVVAPLALGDANRMDRRKVQHVKSHRSHVIKPGFAVPEGTVLACAAGRARKHFVPGAEPGLLPVHPDRKLRGGPRRTAAVRIAFGDLSQLRI